jgi:hypothetical protein
MQKDQDSGTRAPDRTLALRVDAFGGCGVEDCARDLCALANRVGILCELQFNDVKLWAWPGQDPAALVASYYHLVDSDRRHKIAQAA